MKVLVVGTTDSIGHLVVEEALRQGHSVRTLGRDPRKARRLPAEAQVFAGDLTRPETLSAAVAGVDAIVFTHGADGGGKAGAERVDCGGVRNVLTALAGRSWWDCCLRCGESAGGRWRVAAARTPPATRQELVRNRSAR